MRWKQQRRERPDVGGWRLEAARRRRAPPPPRRDHIDNMAIAKRERLVGGVVGCGCGTIVVILLVRFCSYS